MPFVGTYPLATSDGAETYLGLANGGLVKRYAKPSATFATRTAAMAATIPAGVKSISTDAFAAPGDGGRGDYVRLAATPALPTNTGYLRSVDRVRLDGTTDATNGGYWALVPEGGQVRIEQFGGKADGTSGTAGTDNLTPLLDAIAFGTFAPYSPEPTFQYTHEIKFGLGKYRFSQGPELLKVCRIIGIGGVLDSQGVGTATQWLLPANAQGLLVAHSNTSGESGDFSPVSGVNWRTAAGSVIQGISIIFDAGSTDSTKRGVHVRALCTLRDIRVYNAPGAAFYVHATAGAGGAAEGDVNDTAIDDCAANRFGIGTSGNGPRAGLYIEGNDANAIRVTGFITHGASQGCGIIDASGSGCNVFSGVQITAYGNRGVHRAGRLYVLITYLDLGSITIPGTDDKIWYDIGAGLPDSSYSEWSSSETYFPQLAILTGGQPSVFIGCYREGAGWSHAPGSSQVIGGNLGCTRYTNFQSGNASHTGFKGIQTRVSGQPAYAAFGAESYAQLGYSAGGSAAEVDKGIGIWGHKGVDGEVYDFRYYNGDIVWWRGSSYAPLMEVTTTATTKQFQRGVPQPHRIVFEDLILRNSSDSNDALAFGRINEGPPSSGPRGRGEFYIESNPAGMGVAAWTCTVAGTPGTWAGVPVFGMTSVSPQRNGHLVVECTSNTLLTFKYRGSDGVIRTGTMPLA